MELINRTIFPGAAFQQYGAAGGFDVVVALRGQFVIVPGAPVRALPAQPPFLWTDQYAGNPATAPLLRQSDLVPFKPGTDVTVLADAHSPDPEGARRWICGLRLKTAAGETRLEKQLQVTGPRFWRPPSEDRSDWILSSPEPVNKVAVDWRLARGGALPGAPPGTVDQNNPLGLGIIGPGTPRHRPVGAPQIETVAAPLQTAADDLPPAGLGPVSPAWWPRRRHAGTYDEAWRTLRHPRLPADFDDRFWQCAPPDQIVSPWLRGTERFALFNLHEDYLRLTGTLPGIMPGLTIETPGAPPRRLALNLDGVHFDLRAGRAEATLTWRARLPLAQAQGTRLTVTERARVADREIAA